MDLKQKTYLVCQEILSEKRLQLLKAIDDVQKSLGSESKSTAGDKHETGRAMLQLEREKLGQQLKQLQQMEALLIKAEHTKTQNNAVLGSFIKTNLGYYYLGVSLGQLKVGNYTVFAISLQSPMGKQLFGKSEGDSFSFNDRGVDVLEIM